MTLPTSGALSLNDIKGEFGGPAAPSLNDYYAGGTYVPSGTTGTNGAVPSSGAISINNFYGTSAASTLAISISPGDLYTNGSGTVTSATDTASASGGAGGYSYLWTYESGNSFTINSPSSAATTFTTFMPGSTFKTGVYRCTVTDSLSNTAFADVNITFESF